MMMKFFYLLICLFILSCNNQGGAKNHISDTLQSKKELSAPVYNMKDTLSKYRKKLSFHYDEMKGSLVIRDKSTSEYANVNQVSACIFFKAANKDSVTNKALLAFELNYEDDDWLFIQDAIFKIDDNEPIQIGLYDIKRDNNGGKVWEYLTEKANDNEFESLLIAISKAKNVKMRLNGRQHYRERNLSKKEIMAIKNVLDAYNSLKKAPEITNKYQIVN